MLHPSYADLINIANSEVEPGDQPLIQSRYSIVLAASRRARQIIGGAEPLVRTGAGKKPLSIAVEELYKGKVKITSDENEINEEEKAEEYFAKKIQAGKELQKVLEEEKALKAESEEAESEGTE